MNFKKPENNQQNNQSQNNNNNQQQQQQQEKYFLYLIQGPSDLPNELEQSLKTNRSELVMLSYKEQSKSSTLYFPNSTWTQGRNLLYHYAKRLEESKNVLFKYWIFLDEDVKLNVEQLRKFENFLLEYEPAVGIPKIPWNPRTIIQESSRKQQLENGGILPVYHFDAIFNAFHREAVEWLLPYNNSFDSSSWWTSQLILIHKAGMWFQSHVLEFSEMTVSNPSSRPYPRSKKYWREIQDGFGDSLPEEMKNCFSDKGQLGFNVTTKSLLWGSVRRKDGTYKYPPSFERLKISHPHYQFNSELECKLHT